jgi:hypothetical protein
MYCFEHDMLVTESNDNAVVVDEDAAGSVDMPGCGAKILRGDGALEQYLTRTDMNSRV